MLMRDELALPRTSEPAEKAVMSEVGTIGVTWPARITDCGESGRLMRTMRDPAGFGGVTLNALTPFATAGAFQSANAASSWGFTAASVSFETTNSSALSGLSQASLKPTSWARVKLFTVASVPDADPP